MGFQQRRTTHAGWPTTAPVVPESPELYAPQPPASGDVQFAHATRRRQQAASVAALCFTALVLTPEIVASAHDTNSVIEAAQTQSRALTQYQAHAAPVFVPGVAVIPEVPATAGVIDAAQAQPRRLTQYQSIAAPIAVPAAVLSGDVVWTGPSSGAWNFVDGPLRFTTPGTYTLTFSITAQLRITGIAGSGGARAGGLDSTQSTGGSGGGSAASDATGVVIATTPAETFTVVIGARGVGGSSTGANGTAGGSTSYVGSVQGTVFLMGGGGGGTTSGGTAGAATTGSTNKQPGAVGGAGAIESTSTQAAIGSSGATGGGGGGGSGPSGSSSINTGKAGGAGTSEAGGVGGNQGVDGQSTAAAEGGGGLGANVYGGGGAGGGLLLPGGDIPRGGGGGGGGGANSGGVVGSGGDGSDGILVLTLAAPEVRPTADTGILLPERAWQYQQTAAPVYFELTVPPINEPPIGLSDGPASTIEAAAVGRPRVVQYQAQAGPVFISAYPAGSATAVYPSRLFRRAYPTSAQLATVLPPPQPVPTFTEPVYPDRLDRRPALAASMRAFAWAPVTPADYPIGSATAVYPRWFPRRPALAASMPSFAWHTATPETYPTGSASAVYPSRLTRRDYRTSDQQALGWPTFFTEPEPPAPDFVSWSVYPNRLDGRPPRAAYMPAVGWNPSTVDTYPLGSATAIYPRWFPRPAMLASQQQALGWSTVTPGLNRASEPVYPSRTVGRPARAAYAQAVAWQPLTPETAPVTRPTADAGLVLPERAWQYQQTAAPVFFEPETPPLAGWTPTAPRWFARKPAPQQQAYAAPLFVVDVTVPPPDLVRPVFPSRLERAPSAPFSELFIVAPVYVPDVTATAPELTPPVYPSRLTRLHTLPQHLAATQPIATLPPDIPPDLVLAIYPDRIDRRRAPQHLACAWAPVTPEAYPIGSATAVYPRWFPLRASRAAWMQAIGWGLVTPPDVQPGEFFFTSIYPRRLDRAPRTLHGYAVAPIYVPDVTLPAPTLQPPPVYPRRIDRRVIRPGTIPSRAVLPIIPPDQFPEPPPTICVTAPPTVGCWPPADHQPSVKPIGRAGRQRP